MITLKMIYESVLDTTGFDPALNTRKREVPLARQIYYFLACKYTNYSQQKICKFIGKQNRSNMSLAINKIVDLINAKDKLTTVWILQADESISYKLKKNEIKN